MLIHLELDKNLSVNFDPEDYHSIKTGTLPLKDVANHILKVDPDLSSTKITFNATNRADLSYSLLEHIVFLLKVKVPCYVQYDNDIECRVAPNSIFTYTIRYDVACLNNIDTQHHAAFILANITDLPYATEV